MLNAGAILLVVGRHRARRHPGPALDRASLASNERRRARRRGAGKNLAGSDGVRPPAGGRHAQRKFAQRILPIGFFSAWKSSSTRPMAQ